MQHRCGYYSLRLIPFKYDRCAAVHEEHTNTRIARPSAIRVFRPIRGWLPMAALCRQLLAQSLDIGGALEPPEQVPRGVVDGRNIGEKVWMLRPDQAGWKSVYETLD